MTSPANDDVYDLMADLLGDLTPEQCEEIDSLLKAGNLEDAYSKCMQYGEEIARKELHGLKEANKL